MFINLIFKYHIIIIYIICKSTVGYICLVFSIQTAASLFSAVFMTTSFVSQHHHPSVNGSSNAPTENKKWRTKGFHTLCRWTDLYPRIHTNGNVNHQKKKKRVLFIIITSEPT